MPFLPKSQTRPWLLSKEKSTKHQGRTARTHLYDTYRWKRERKLFLDQNPLCCICERDDKRVVAATVVDHIKAVNQGGSFWDSENNWRPMCLHHHQRNSALQRYGKQL